MNFLNFVVTQEYMDRKVPNVLFYKIGKRMQSPKWEDTHTSVSIDVVYLYIMLKFTFKVQISSSEE